METTNSDLDQLRRELQDLLGADRLPDEDVLMTALEQPAYAEQLMANRNNTEALAQLLAHPPKEPLKLGQIRVRHFSNAELAVRAGRAMWHWARSGFGTASESVLRQREAACLVCPHLQEPQLLAQQLISSSQVADADGLRLGNNVCGACGCSLKKKIRLTSESCPVASDDQPGLNRWGEPVDGQ